MKTFNEFVGFFKKKKESPRTLPPKYSAADIQRAYGVSSRTKDGRGVKSTIPALSGPSTNRVGSVNRTMNRSSNIKGYQSAIGRAEHGGKDDQYNVVFGGGTFDTTKGHPDKVVDGGKYSSAAAGKYQFMPGTWKGVTGSVKTPMTRSNQDKAATSLIKSRGVNLDLPMTRRSVNKLSGEWASLPDKSGKSRYGQPVKSYSQLRSWFNKKKREELGPDYHDAPGANYAR